jgi:hypothetical protein
MSTLSPDEKLCPYCAETIKAAAVKCRFCQSDLTIEPAPGEPALATAPEFAPVEVAEPEADAGPEPEPEPEPEPAFPTDDTSRLDVPRVRVTGVRVVAALLVLCLVLAGTLWFLVDRSRHPDLGTAPNGQVTDSSFRNAAMSAASDAAAQALSYSWNTFEEDRKKARALMGPKLAKQYDAAMDQVTAQTASSKLTLKATVLSAGLLSAEKHKAKVLLFVNTLTTREGSKKQQLDQNRVVMDLTRKDGEWTVSQMDAF